MVSSREPSERAKTSSQCFIIIIILMVIGAILFVNMSDDDCKAQSAPKPADVCKTGHCISLSHRLHNWRDEKVDPCDNFHQYTCGRYVENVDSDSVPMGWKEDLMDNSILDYLTKLKNPKNKMGKTMKLFLEYCEKWRAEKVPKNLDEHSLKDLFSDVRKVGKWPMIDADFSDDDFNLNDYLDKMLGNRKGLFEIVYPFANAHITIQPDQLFKGHFQAVNLTISRMLKLHNISAPNLQKDLDDVKEFIQKLQPVAISDHREYYIMPVDVAELKTRYGKIDFERILFNSMSPKQWDHLKSKLFLDWHISDDTWRRHINELIETTPPKILANFLIVREIINAEYQVRLPEKHSCIRNAINRMPQAAIAITVRYYFNKKNREKVSEVVDDLQNAFQRMVASSTWLQVDTKKNALKKLEKMKKLIGYPEEFMDLDGIEKKFEEVGIQESDSYYVFRGKLVAFERDFALEEALSDTPIVSSAYLMTVNGFSVLDVNTILIPVPAIDDPLFDESYPKYAQFASIGYLVGHEIGHGFDPVGGNFDENGQARDWWTQQDRKEYARRAQCFREKYEDYDDPVYGKHLNGTKSLNENVADFLGARGAWDAYKAFDSRKEQKIIGFEDYSTDKLFFQILATTWCSRTNIEPIEKLDGSIHAVDNYRVNGVFSNMKEFAETFNCPVGSKMNPEKRCPLF